MILDKTIKTTVKRNAKRASYDLTKIKAVIDAAMIGHLAFELEHQSHSIPLLFWHHEDWLYCHAAVNGRLLALANNGARVCVSFVINDGIVLSKSALHHSVNYRSAVVYGCFERLSDHVQMQQAFQALMHLVDQQRWQTIRPPSAKELNACALLRMPLNEAVMKQRTGFADEKKSDLNIAAWTGVIPIEHHFGKPQADVNCTAVISEKLRRLLKK